MHRRICSSRGSGKWPCSFGHPGEAPLGPYGTVPRILRSVRARLDGGGQDSRGEGTRGWVRFRRMSVLDLGNEPHCRCMMRFYVATGASRSACLGARLPIHAHRTNAVTLCCARALRRGTYFLPSARGLGQSLGWFCYYEVRSVAYARAGTPPSEPNTYFMKRPLIHLCCPSRDTPASLIILS